ncbi:MAG: hypothetical protein RLZZ271_696 [Pseudomonadota bacterium]|jgi:hypothetical protein
MYSCPVCKEQTIGFIRKLISRPSVPARCSSCNAYSHSYYSSVGTGVVGAAVIITLMGIMASALHSVWPLLLGGAASVAFYVRHIHRLPLDPITPESVKAAREADGSGLFVGLLMIFFN